MKNAELTINNGAKFSDDIWQYEAEFTEKQWRETIEEFANVLQDAYGFLDQELYDENGNDVTYPDDMLYQIGDVINMLRSIDVFLMR